MRFITGATRPAQLMQQRLAVLIRWFPDRRFTAACPQEVVACAKWRRLKVTWYGGGLRTETEVRETEDCLSCHDCQDLYTIFPRKASQLE